MESGFWAGYAWPAIILVIKIVAVIVPVVLFMASRTVKRDVEKVQAWMRDAAVAKN